MKSQKNLELPLFSKIIIIILIIIIIFDIMSSDRSKIAIKDNNTKSQTITKKKSWKYIFSHYLMFLKSLGVKFVSWGQFLIFNYGLHIVILAGKIKFK